MAPLGSFEHTPAQTLSRWTVLVSFNSAFWDLQGPCSKSALPESQLAGILRGVKSLAGQIKPYVHPILAVASNALTCCQLYSCMGKTTRQTGVYGSACLRMIDCGSQADHSHKSPIYWDI